MIFEYHDSGTVIHRLDPRVKTLWLVVLVITAIVVREPLLLVLLFCITLLPLIIAKMPGRQWTLLLLLYLMVGVGAILTQALFYAPSDGTILPGIWLIPPEVPLLGQFTGGVKVSALGALYGFIQAFRILSVINASAVLVVTTPLNRLIIGLREMGVPGTFAFMLSTAVRFVPVLMEEYQTIITALRARNLISPWHPLRFAEQSFAPLIINVIRRCNQLALAAESRGFNMDNKRTAYVHLRFGNADVAACFLMTGMVLFFAASSLRIAGFLP